MTSLVSQPYEVAIVGKEHQKFRDKMDNEYLPNVLFLGGEKEGNLPLLENKLIKGQTTIFVCTNKVCDMPVTSPGKALGIIK